MSRKTRKLMWSAPLIAAVAVVGALAAFITLQPNEAAAQEALPGMVQMLAVAPHTDGTPQTELLVTWEEPTDGAAPTSYRIDISDDGDRWFSHVTDHGDGDHRLVYEGLKPTDTKYFRVFALNEDLEAGPGTDTMGTTSASTNPMKPTNLEATDAGDTDIVTADFDLNGDGDTDDTVDKISEATVGIDLNGDGDINDTLDEVSEKAADLDLNGDAAGATGYKSDTIDMFAETGIMGLLLPGSAADDARTVIRLNWDAPDDPPGAPVKYYRIQYRIGQGAWRTLVDKAVPGGTGDAKIWYHSGLNADVTRQYRVFAQNEPRGPGNAIGMSGPSDGDSGSTADSTAPDAPTVPVIGLSPAATDVHLKWMAPTDPAGDPVSHYRIQAALGTADGTAAGADVAADANTGYKNLHTGKHIDRTSVYNFGGADLTNAGIDVPQNIDPTGLVVDIRIAAINRANTDDTDAEIATATGWLNLNNVPVGHHSAPKRAGTPTVKRDNDRHQGRSGLNVTWPKADFIVDPVPGDDDISYILVVGTTENEIEHAAALGNGGAADDKPGYDDDGLSTETTRAYQLYARNDDITVGTVVVRSFPSGKASLTTSRPTKPGMPTGFTVVPDGHTEIKVSWMAPTEVAVEAGECDGTNAGDSSDGSECGDSVITGYKIQRAPVNADGQPGRWMDLTTEGKSKTSYTDSNLEPDTSFFYQVFAENSQRSSDPTAPKSATTHPAGEPTPPGGLVAQSDGYDTIKLCWYEQNVPDPEGQTDEGLPVIGYRVVYLGGADGMTEVTLQANSMSQNTEYEASGLMPNTTYTFRVYSITLGGVGTTFDEATATTDMANAPGMPTAVSAAETSDTEITVTWSSPASDGGADITGYMVQSAYEMSDGTMSDWMDVDPAHTGMTMSYMDTDLMEMTKYYYRVAAVNAAGTGEYSDGMAYAMTERTNVAPVAGEALTATVTEDRTVMVQSMFTDADPEDATLTYSSPAMSSDATVATATVDSAGMVEITGVSVGTATIMVTATDNMGESATQTIAVTVTSANVAPMADGTISPVSVTAGEMTPEMDVSGYFSDANMDELTYTATSDMMQYATADIPTGSSMLTITGVAAGSATVTVTAMDPDGGSATQTIAVTVTTAMPTRPTISTVSVLQNSISVTWDPASIVGAEIIKVALFDLNDNGDIVRLAMGYDGNLHSINPATGDPGAHTFTNVPDGTYKVGVANFANGEHRTIVSSAQTVSAP